MAAWPGALPAKLLREGFEETLPDNTIGFATSAGPGKLRKRTTANARPLSGGLPLLTDAQKATLETFYQDNQALAWTSDLRDSGGTENYRFTGAPRFREANCEQWAVNLNLIVLP